MTPASSQTLPTLLDELESALGLVQQALTQRDALQLELYSGQVQKLMQAALRSARDDDALGAPLRQRLARAGAQLAAQRQALFRATTALDRAIELLMPAEPDSQIGLYGQSGRGLRKLSSGDSVTA